MIHAMQLISPSKLSLKQHVIINVQVLILILLEMIVGLSQMLKGYFKMGMYGKELRSKINSKFQLCPHWT
jgi:hypothetical protein